MLAGPHRVLLRLCVLLAAVSALPAAEAWQSRLVTGTGRPIVGARVADARGGAAAITGPDGEFELHIEDSPPLLLVEFADGTVVLVRLPARGSPPAQVTVDPSRSESVEAVASAAGHLLAAPASPVTTISTREVAERGDESVQEAIAHLPGTSPASADPDRVPALRGGSDNRTLLLIDAGRVPSERRAGFSGGALHPATWGGVEVIRGPAAFLYGSGAMGGVILVRSPWAAVEGSAAGEVTTQVQGGGAPSASLGLRWREQGWSLAAGTRSSSDPTDARSRRLEGSYRQQSVFAGRSWTRAGSVYHLGLRTDRLGDAVRLAYPGPDRSLVVPGDENFRLTFQADRPGPIDRALVAWVARGRRQVLQLRGPSGDWPASRQGSTTRATDLGARWLLRSAGPGGSWAAGVETGLRTGIEVDNSVVFAGRPPAGIVPAGEALSAGQALSVAAFGLWRRHLTRRVEFSLGARFEPTWSRAEVGQTGQRSASPAWAAGASLASHTRMGSLTFQLARTFRQPSVTDRFAETLTGRGLKLANPDLDAETALQADLAWRLDLGSLHLGAAVYRYAMDEVIVRSFIEDEPSALAIYRFVNRAAATVEGIEVEARLRPSPGWEISGSLQRIRGRTGEGEPLGELPPDGGRLVVRHSRGRAFVRGEVFVALADRHPGPGEVPTPFYTIVDLAAGTALSERWTLRARLDNALDRLYPLGARRRDPAAPGRTLALSVEYRFR